MENELELLRMENNGNITVGYGAKRYLLVFSFSVPDAKVLRKPVNIKSWGEKIAKTIREMQAKDRSAGSCDTIFSVKDKDMQPGVVSDDNPNGLPTIDLSSSHLFRGILPVSITQPFTIRPEDERLPGSEKEFWLRLRCEIQEVSDE